MRVSGHDSQVIEAIVQRAIRDGLITATHRLASEMDITATHANGCPLDLAAFYNMSPLNFGHDFRGIARHIDRDTGKLGGCFVPRCALPE